MPTVAVIGAGDLGGAVAHALASSHRIHRVVIVDERGAVAAGKALDLRQSGAIAGWHVDLAGTDDLSRAAGASVCVLADRAGPPAAEWQSDAAASLLGRLVAYLGQAPIVFAGASQHALLVAAARDLGVAPGRLIGSSSEAMTAAVRALVALEARCSVTEVALTVLGAPPRGFVVPWHEASIGGYALTGVLDQVQIVRLEERLGPLWPPGPHALGLAAARVTEAVLGSSRRRLSVVSVIDGAFGVRQRAGALPCLLAPTGIAHAHVPRLAPRDRVRIETALARQGG